MSDEKVNGVHIKFKTKSDHCIYDRVKALARTMSYVNGRGNVSVRSLVLQAMKDFVDVKEPLAQTERAEWESRNDI